MMPALCPPLVKTKSMSVSSRWTSLNTDRQGATWSLSVATAKTGSEGVPSTPVAGLEEPDAGGILRFEGNRLVAIERRRQGADLGPHGLLDDRRTFCDIYRLRSIQYDDTLVTRGTAQNFTHF